MRIFISFSRTFFLAMFFFIAVFLLFSSIGRKQVLPILSYPFMWGAQCVTRPIKQLYNALHGIHYFQNTADRLLKERNEFLRELIVLKGTHDYLEDSRECKEFKKRYEPEATFVAAIIMKHFSDQGHYYYLDAGENRGIKKDMVVIYDNCLIGRVSEVFPLYCKVMLISDKECHVAVRCVESGACGIHSGINAVDQSVMEYVNHLDTIYEDDLIISHGEGLIFPHGFAVGRIAAYSLDGVQYKVTIKPLMDLTELTHCLVLLKY